jgi:PAB-dependent poly(A)-specific ribonuclease subunit 2
MKWSRYICAATFTGSVNFLDPVTFSLVKTWKAHSASIIDMDAQNDFVVTCGCSFRQGSHPLDHLVNVFDLKNMAPASPIPFPPGPTFARLLPRMSTTSIVISQYGQIHVVDLMNPNTSNVKQANVLSYLTKVEIAPSGEAMAMADAECNVHLWGSPARIRFAELSNPVELADPEETHEQIEWTVDA